ncbi:MAG: hypothetical protein EAZ58_08895 [Flavobacterium sp.]|nr:MAG: hypothetical protein EAZ58_08895 [Flavobacterium sp.]
MKDLRLLKRGNTILDKLFKNSVHSIRQITQSDSEAKSFYRFYKITMFLKLILYVI